MRKNTLSLFVFFLVVLCSGNIFAQGYYNGSGSSKQDKKYYIAFSYGVGTTRWYSHFYDAPLYNTDGSIIQSGNLHMTTTNPSFNYNFSVCAPVGNVRLGAGICFEKFSMDKLSIISSSDSIGANIPNSYVLFTENFWFNKIYGMVQVPFSFCAGKPYSLDFISCIGFYGYNGLRHLNFFGNDQVAKTYFGNVGFLLDYYFLEYTRIFIYPALEYKYFHNNLDESPSVIVHNIFTLSISFGIRIDVSKF
jgi:hypothetical protein